MNTNARMYSSRPSRAVKDCPQPEPPDYQPIVYVPQLRFLPVCATNDEHPEPTQPTPAMECAA